MKSNHLTTISHSPQTAKQPRTMVQEELLYFDVAVDAPKSAIPVIERFKKRIKETPSVLPGIEKAHIRKRVMMYLAELRRQTETRARRSERASVVLRPAKVKHLPRFKIHTNDDDSKTITLTVAMKKGLSYCVVVLPDGMDAYVCQITAASSNDPFVHMFRSLHMMQSLRGIAARCYPLDNCASPGNAHGPETALMRLAQVYTKKPWLLGETTKPFSVVMSCMDVDRISTENGLIVMARQIRAVDSKLCLCGAKLLTSVFADVNSALIRLMNGYELSIYDAGVHDHEDRPRGVPIHSSPLSAQQSDNPRDRLILAFSHCLCAMIMLIDIRERQLRDCSDVFKAYVQFLLNVVVAQFIHTQATLLEQVGSHQLMNSIPVVQKIPPACSVECVRANALARCENHYGDTVGSVWMWIDGIFPRRS